MIADAAAHPDAQIRDLFEGFVPEEKPVQRFGAVIKPAEILTLTGDPVRGWQVFLQSGQCKNCHRVGNEGTEIGPDLSQIGKKLDRARILESILEPSKVIDPAYTTYLVETTNGTLHTGLIVRKSEKEVQLKDAQGKITTLSVAMIDSITPQRISMMPELLLRDMTPREVADLLEYLGSLK